MISVGHGNRYGHPTVEALTRLQQAGAEIRRTDDEGTVTVETDGTRMTIASRSGTEQRLLVPAAVIP